MNILIAYENNITLKNILRETVSRAKKLNDFIYILWVCPMEIKEIEKVKIKNQINKFKDDLSNQGIENSVEIIHQVISPGQLIIDYAKEKKIDEIIIGIKKKSVVGKFLFGSTAQYIILESHCPVLCVHL